MLYISFTADHELYFGKNFYSEEKVLIKPTYDLINLLNSYKISLTLFTDVCSIFRYRQLGKSEYPELMEEQLKFAIRNKNDVQLHLHPHWYYTTEKDNKWIPNRDYYSLHDFGFKKNNSELNAINIINSGKEYLQATLRPIDKSYECIAFRAGGWCLQPEKDVIEALYNAGIIIDSTVYKGGYLNNGIHYFDFRDTPSKLNWWINARLGLSKEADNISKQVFEVPIGSFYSKPELYLLKLKHKFYSKLSMNRKNEKRGETIDSYYNSKSSKLRNVKNRIYYFLNSPIILDFHATSYRIMIDIIEYHIKNFDCSNNDHYISIITHPKNIFTEDLRQIDKFCSFIKGKYDNKVKFITMQEINSLIQER